MCKVEPSTKLIIEMLKSILAYKLKLSKGNGAGQSQGNVDHHLLLMQLRLD